MEKEKAHHQVKRLHALQKNAKLDMMLQFLLIRLYVAAPSFHYLRSHSPSIFLVGLTANSLRQFRHCTNGSRLQADFLGSLLQGGFFHVV